MDIQNTMPQVRRDIFVWVMMLLVGSMLIWLSLARYQGYNAGMFDLGNMTQAIWSVVQGKPLLYSRPEGFAASRLAGHVELGYLLFAPLYAILPDPQTLLVAQAVLFACGAIAAYRLAARRTQSRYAARCAALIYLLYPVALTAVLFDFHADTLALPIFMLALDALDERAWRRYALWIAIALSLKFYCAAVVVGIGMVTLLWGGQRRAAIMTILAGVCYGILVFFVIRPLFAHASAGDVGAVTSNYFNYYFGQLRDIGATLGERMLNAIVVFGPIALIGWRGWRWLLPGVPIALAALLTTGPGGAFDYRYHHYALVVPFLLAALVDGIVRAQARPRKRGGRSWQGDLGLTCGIVVLCAAILVDTPLNPLFWLRIPGSGLDSAKYGVIARDRIKDAFLARIPPQARVMASNFLAPHLANRNVLYLTRYPDESSGPERLPTLLPQADIVLADALFDVYVPLDNGYAGGVDGDREVITYMLRDPYFGLESMRDGILLFSRTSAGSGMRQSITTSPDDGRPAIQRFGGAIELVEREIGPIQNLGRIQLRFTWRVTGGFGGKRYLAVSQLVDLPHARFVHLPSYALIPAWEWQPGMLYTETFEVELPTSRPDHFIMKTETNWYDLTSPYAYLTDARSRLPE